MIDKNMDLSNFITNFRELFETSNSIQITSETEFKLLDEWNSMFAMSLIIMIENQYGITLKNKDIRNAETIEDLFLILKG